MDPHPADSMLEALKEGFDGTAFKQTLRDAWDRLHGSPAPDDHQKYVDSVNKQANDQRVADTNKAFIMPDAAATIRKKAMQK